MQVKTAPYSLDPGDAKLFLSDDRQEGPHLTEMIREAGEYAKLASVKPRRNLVEMSGRERSEFFAATEVGYLWEELLTHFFRPRMLTRREREVNQLSQQVVVQMDGVWMTLDAVDVGPTPAVVEEYKATTRSVDRWREAEKARKLDVAFWFWMTQIKSECLGVGTVRARLFVLWLAGDWHGSGALVTRHDLHFTEEELRDSWRGLMARHRQKQGQEQRQRKGGR